MLADRNHAPAHSELAPQSAKGEAFEAEANSSLLIGVLHFFVVFAAPALLWNSPVVEQRYLAVWIVAEAMLGVVSLAASWSIRQRRVDQFVRRARIESIGTAFTFSALAWLGDEIATQTPSKHVLMIALLAVTSVSAANSSHITRRRPFFGRLIVIVACSYTSAFALHGELIFAVLTILWCVAIATLTRVGYHGMVELLELRKASEQTARHDDLTGLLNRSAFFETLNLVCDDAPAPSQTVEEHPVLVLFDLDGFKAINDSFGHASGDAVLRTVAERLRQELPHETAIGRLGGDEFAAVFRVTPNALTQTITAALTSVSEPVRIDGRELFVAASAGWTLVEQGERSADLMAQADAAMYQSKNSQTSDSSGFNADLRDELDRSLVLRQRFRAALKRQEIHFWAQPIVRLADRTPVAVELLARWPQDDATIIGPGEFTRVADETGLAVELDRQALVAARKLLSSWANDELLSTVVVKANISPVHLHNGQLVQSVREIVPARLRGRLGLEFVESRLIPAAERNHEQLRTLRDMGITVSIDDFGVGYSSLAYLRSLPVSEIKIDRSFVRRADEDRINQGLLRAIVDIASTLGLPTVAEGIESQRELDAVTRLGVSLGQGYHLGHPSPLTYVSEVLRELQAEISEPEAPKDLGSHTPGQLRFQR